MQNDERDDNTHRHGPFTYENWADMNAGHPLDSAFEFPIFTDAHILGELTSGFGPYVFLNTVPGRSRRKPRPSIVVRVAQYTTYDPSRMVEASNEDRYHGGGPRDELAALLSLCLGIRAQAGRMTRRFDVDGDPLGYPVEWDESE